MFASYLIARAVAGSAPGKIGEAWRIDTNAYDPRLNAMAHGLSSQFKPSGYAALVEVNLCKPVHIY